MKKPLILHFILDGYSPSNKDNFFDDFKKVLPNYYSDSFVRVAPDESKLRSPDMWTRCYSKTSFEEVHEEGDSARLGVSTKIGRVPPEKFIWNKLSSKGVNSWIYPYGQYYRIASRNFLSDNSSHVSGFLKMYGTKLGCIINHGKLSWEKSPLSMYYGWHEASWNRESKHTDVFNDYRDLWKNPTDEFISRVPREVHDYYMDRLTHYRNMNELLFYEEVLPNLQERINDGDFEDGGYVHIGLVETDTPYHFVPEYPDGVRNIRDYCNRLITTSVNMLNPDIIIITGDHGMEPVTAEEYTNAILLDYTRYSGVKRHGAQSSWGITPILNEHSREVGGMLYAKDFHYLDEFEKGYYQRDKYLMYDFYNFILDNF